MRLAIGDLQGQIAPLERLLDAAAFDAASDQLWLTGDLVNRGQDNAAVLRRVRDLGDSAVTVLGNHDFYLLAVASGAMRRGADDTLDDILNAPDREALLDWLRFRPLMHVADGFAMVHAGLLPGWSISQARLLAHEVEGALQGPHWKIFLQNLWGSQPLAWDEKLEGWDRLRVIVNAMCRMRMCSIDGEMALKHKGPIDAAPAGVLPWFAVPKRRSKTHTVVCGHWSALGYYADDGILALDTGCVWGGCLTGVWLESGARVEVKCDQTAAPSGWD
ncbi:symmetrical bis(5'-nucleosyl)-tetraphosphatase [Niveibacterium umoris]|uniref:bis(5'-nucleosyl)-tetraphosphatase (symmetrical) n=1 Tax=Niveibacterium umoris TaxID=1193620 RepID=A0A840BPV6_9RHOO|nr:symmetrical bis(5'-nucleosyl)-tetraphosphatase [Niveibacterium umoris]MBB4012876.1 bis(5'-nucleosyl)-tetraphosphatase (symmetrical) [Niveibacterium umoris]